MPSFSPKKGDPRLKPNRPFKKRKPRENKTRMGSDGDEGGTACEVRRSTPSGVFRSNERCRDGIHCHVTTYICLKKVRAKDTITSQRETSEEVRENRSRAVGAKYGEEMNSALRVRANSEGGRKARNEILIVSFFESKIYL